MMRICLRLTCTLTLGLSCLSVIQSVSAEERQPQLPNLKIEKYQLDNGLEVILQEDHTTPVVGVNVWYKVGSKDEKPGRTGFAHLFEHLMFQGSQHHDHEYFGPIEKLGAVINGSTNTDRTNYFETLPSNGLELALWLEADRMGFLLPALSQQKLDNQRDVVKNERRQRVDNVPYGQSMEALLKALYPPDHPYHHSVIGSMADLSAASLADVSAFFRTYYSPSNASLCIAGDFEPAQAKRLVERYFGSLPKGPAIERPKPQSANLREAKHVTMTDRVSLARTQLVWPTVERGHADAPALDVLAAILGQLPTENRLEKALIYDQQLASDVRAMHSAEAVDGTLDVTITARPRQALDDLVAKADTEIERLKSEGPTAGEVRRAQTAEESRLIMGRGFRPGLQAIGSRADLLNQYNVFYGNPRAYESELKKHFAVTAADVQRVAKTYLTAKRIRLDVNPGPPTPRAPEVAVDRSTQKDAKAPQDAAIHDAFDRGIMPTPGGNPPFSPPPVVRRRLSNGLEVLIAERHALPILTLALVIKGGETLVPEGKGGLASLTAALMTEGTQKRDALQLAVELHELGASLNATGRLESSTVTLSTLTRHTEKALELFADVLLNPAFPQKDFQRQRTRRLAALLRQRDNPVAIADVVFPRILYGKSHPYGRPDLGTPESVRSLTRDDLQSFYKRLYHPNNAALIVAGDTTPGAIVDSLEKALKDWAPGDVPESPLAEPPPEKPLAVYLVDRPAAAQSVLMMGQVGAARKTPDYFALSVGNATLGGQFSSRINLNLREDKGYTYGARSRFEFRQGRGPFEATASVQTAVTKDALNELVKELRDIVGPRPVTDAELAFAKDRLVKGFPNRFETTANLAGMLEDLVLFNLADDYYTAYQSRIEAVTSNDVAKAIKAHLDPDHMAILIVGDRGKVESQLKSLPYAQDVHVLDPDGNPVSPAEAGGAK